MRSKFSDSDRVVRVIATETFLSRLTEITRMDLLFPELVLLDPPLLGLFVSLVLPS